MAKKTEKKESKTVMAKKTEKKESKTVYVRGILTDAFFGVKNFAKGKNGTDKYRYSIKALAEDMEALVEAAEPFYKNTDAQWRPKWLTDENAREFLNLASQFDIKAGIKEDGQIKDLGNLVDDYIAENGNINGSKVVMMVTIKEDAVYPASILIKELKHVTIADMFNDFDDDLPF